MNIDKPKLAVIPSSDQKAMGLDLMNELRSVINSDKYDHMTIATVIGVLEMTKLHYWNVNTKGGS
jgi:predicted DNA-binding protein with PD1-like motif